MNAEDRKKIKLEVVNVPESNPFETDASSSSSSDSSDSSSSSDSSASPEAGPSKKKQKKRTSKSNKKMLKICKKSTKRLKKQISLFQRNVDVKLNYLESLLQNVLSTQSQTLAAVQSLQNETEANGRANSPDYTPSLQLRISKPRTIKQERKPKISDSQLKAFEQIDVEEPDEEATVEDFMEAEMSNTSYQLPDFPLAELSDFQQFNTDLKDKSYRQFAIQNLHHYTLEAHQDSTKSRMKKLIYSFLAPELLLQFSWTGVSMKKSQVEVETTHKYAL
jgi:hypothetical protein